MSTQNARDTHFFLAGWNGHMGNTNATQLFQQATEKAPPQEPPTTPAAGAPQAVLDSNWKARMLDGRPFDRDEMGFGEHPELPALDEGMKPRTFFEALGIELKHTMAEDDLTLEAHEAMNDASNWSDWTPCAPAGDGWKLVAIFDTEVGQAAWWLRDTHTIREANKPSAAQGEA